MPATQTPRHRRRRRASARGELRDRCGDVRDRLRRLLLLACIGIALAALVVLAHPGRRRRRSASCHSTSSPTARRRFPANAGIRPALIGTL